MSRAKHQITMYLHQETDKAWFIGQSASHRAPDNVWLPRSQCDEVRRSNVPPTT